MNRSTFIKMSALAGTAFTVLPSKIVFGNPSRKLRLAFIGTGLRGQELLRLCLQRKDTEVTAICDIQQLMLDDALQLFEKADLSKPKIYTGSEISYKELLQKHRMETAARLLRRSDMNIQQIISLVGYENTSYFYRLFHERYGLSPREYRLVRTGHGRASA